jgi:moderate conductance mechanosensitive channel
MERIVVILPAMNLFELASEAPLLYRILLIAALAGGAHLIVTIIRRISQLILVGRKKVIETGRSDFVKRFPRTATIITILESTLTFTIYFMALGLILQEFNLSLRAYLASTTVIGLAIGFGSQGLVQDIVIGLTLIFSDLLKVGDVVELSGQVGRVESMGLRYTVLINLHGQRIHMPNRNIGMISQFRGGSIRAYVDFQIPEGATAKRIGQLINPLASALYNQHRAIVMEEPENFGQQSTIKGGWMYIRYKFKLWPGQGALIETNFRQMALARLRGEYPDYADWMINITYRSERLIIKDGGLIDEADSDLPAGPASPAVSG